MLQNTPDTSPTQMNVEETPNSTSSKLFDRIEIENTPFWAIGNKEEGYYLVMNKYRLSEALNTPLDVEIYLEQNKWLIMLTLIQIVNKIETEQTPKN